MSRVAVVTVLAAGALACAASDGSLTRTEPPPTSIRPERVEAFADRFVLVDSLELEQSEDSPIVSMSGLDIGPAGMIAMADASEANVKLFDRRGRLLRIIGRKGEGPGEFVTPRYPRFAPGGRLHVGDSQLARVTVFDTAGHVLSSAMLENMIPIMGLYLSPWSEGGYLATTVAQGPEQQVVHFTDSTGRVTASYLEESRTRPAREPEYPPWRNLSGHTLGTDGRHVYVSSSLSDSLWRIDPATGELVASRIEVPGYEPPFPPEQLPRGIQALMTWASRFHTASHLLVSDRLVLLPFVKGVLNYGDPAVLVARLPGGEWTAFTDAPPPQMVTGDSVITLLHPDDQTRLVLGVHRPR